VTVNDQGSLGPEFQPHGVDAVKPRARSSRILNLALGAAVVVAIAGVAFAVGRGTAPVSAAAGPGGFGNGPLPGGFGNGPLPSGAIVNGGGPGGFGGGASGLTIEGTVTAVDADSVTIETSTGTTIELSIDGSTEYHQQASADASDVTTGSTVGVRVSGFAGRGGPQGGANASAAPSQAAGTTTGTATDISVVP
jgi:hypothetical protein